MFKNLLFIFFVSIFIISCSTKNDLNKVYTTSYCSQDTYIEEKDGLFIEYIKLDSNCEWQGLPLSFFEQQYKSILSLKSMKLVESIDFDEYKFNTYKIDDDSYINLIWISKNFEEKFILDSKGLYFDSEIKKFDKDYENRFLNQKRFYKKYNTSLVHRNIIEFYFIPPSPEK